VKVFSERILFAESIHSTLLSHFWQMWLFLEAFASKVFNVHRTHYKPSCGTHYNAQNHQKHHKSVCLFILSIIHLFCQVYERPTGNCHDCHEPVSIFWLRNHYMTTLVWYEH